jgi:hypothetical protein
LSCTRATEKQGGGGGIREKEQLKRAREGEINNGARCIEKLRVAGGKHGKAQEGEASRHVRF